MPTTPALTLLPLAGAGEHTHARLAEALADPRVERWLGTPAAVAVGRRMAGDLAGTSVHVVLLVGGEPVGWAGWLRYPEDSACVESTTYLAPRVWRTGVNLAAKALLWQVAAAAGVPLVASVHTENLASLAAMVRAWPDVAPALVHEVVKGRDAYVFALDRPPAVALSWPVELVTALAEAVRNLPAGAPAPPR